MGVTQIMIMLSQRLNACIYSTLQIHCVIKLIVDENLIAPVFRYFIGLIMMLKLANFLLRFGQLQIKLKTYKLNRLFGGITIESSSWAMQYYYPVSKVFILKSSGEFVEFCLRLATQDIPVRSVKAAANFSSADV